MNSLYSFQAATAAYSFSPVMARLNFEGGSAHGYHEHALSYRLIVKIHADYSVSSKISGILLHLPECDVSGKFLPLGGGPASHEIGNGGKNIFNDVCPRYSLTGGDPQIFLDLLTLNGWCSSDDHRIPPLFCFGFVN